MHGELVVMLHVYQFTLGNFFPGTGVSTGSTSVDKAMPASVEYWQRKAMTLHAENEDLRRQLGLAESSKALAVQEVLTQLFVEKVQDVYATGGTMNSPAQRKSMKT